MYFVFNEANGGNPSMIVFFAVGIQEKERKRESESETSNLRRRRVYIRSLMYNIKRMYIRRRERREQEGEGETTEHVVPQRDIQ